MKSFRLRRTTGSWDPFIPNTKEQLHFGPTHFTEVNMKLFEGNPMFDTIMNEIERGVLVDERGMNPFEKVMTEEDAPIHIVDTCELSDEENWPCQYTTEGSCPVPCIHDQTPPEEKDTGFECTDCGAAINEEDTVCPQCGEIFDKEGGPETPAPATAEELENDGKTPPDEESEGPLTPVGEILASLPKDFDEAWDRIGNLSYSDVRDFAKQDGINVKASGKKTEILKRIKKRLLEVWG